MTRRRVPPATQRARMLRQQMNEIERLVWSRLRESGGCRYRRQHPVGRYVVDFACLRHRVAIECDGRQHGDEVDQVRQDYIEKRGWRVMRFPDEEILRDLEAVIEAIRWHESPE